MTSLKDWKKNKEMFSFIEGNFPLFDMERLKEEGRKNPVWLHFGGGNLYRGFHAEIAQILANKGMLHSGIVVCETFDEEIIEKAYKPYDNNFIEVVMKEDGSFENQLIVSTAESLYSNPDNKRDFQKTIHHFENPSLQLVTFTITEKGYGLKNSNGELFDTVKSDLENGYEYPRHTMSIITSLLYRRFLKGSLPIAMVSTDNFSQNGRRLKESVLLIANGWKERGLVPSEFICYLEDESKITFPWSMIDRITPNPAEIIKTKLEQLGIDGMNMIHTSKNTAIATFSNTEETHYLVIEDHFPNGRPSLENAGVILTDRETVDKVDRMKVTTSLNPLHTALAVYGCLFNYHSIASEMQEEDLVKLIKGIGYKEGLPVVENPKIIEPKFFIDEVITKRFPNPYIPDTPQRIATDTSQKVAIRYGETIKRYVEKEGSASQLVFIPLALAGWLRYLLGIDDSGEKFLPSPDPLFEELHNRLSRLSIGSHEADAIAEVLHPILTNESIFGVDLYKAGIGKKVEQLFKEMIEKNGAVRETLHKYVGKEE